MPTQPENANNQPAIDRDLQKLLLRNRSENSIRRLFVRFVENTLSADRIYGNECTNYCMCRFWIYQHIYPISPRSILQYIFFLLQPLSLIGIPKCATCANNNLNKQLFPPCLRNIVFIVMKLILVIVKDAYVQK